MWLLLIGLALLAEDVIAQGAFVQYGVQSPLRPIAPLYHPVRDDYIEYRPRPSRPAIVSNRFPDRDDEYYSGDPCSPTPCGPFTTCERTSRGVARCRCRDGYVPDDNTIDGCKPQCTHSDDCSDDHECRGSQCVPVCRPGACGLHAECRGVRHRADCKCPGGFHGDAHAGCRRTVPDVRDPPEYDVDLCYNACGEGADCRVRGDRPICSCPRGSEGNPLSRCVRGECIVHSDCPDHLACQQLRCIDPCQVPGICGQGADCKVQDNKPICSCPPNFIGDPFISCRRITEDDVCQPGVCADNTNCRARQDRSTGSLRAVCSCIENYLGDPIGRGCYPECVRDTECNRNQNCRDNRCRNPCVDACGTNAYCDVVNHRAVCRCPEYYQGDPHSRCFPQCTKHEECPSYQACSKFHCIDPCEGACGTRADCEVNDHTAICSCPKTMTGDPFVSCRLFTDADLCEPNPCGSNADCHPGHDRSGSKRPVCTCPRGYIGNPLIQCQRGECESHETCPDHQACYAYQCQNPCVYELGSVCGENANCKVKNHQPICSCPRGYEGNPIEGCRVAANARRPAGGGHQIAYTYDS